MDSSYCEANLEPLNLVAWKNSLLAEERLPASVLGP